MHSPWEPAIWDYLPPVIDRRKKPRLRILACGLVHYSYTIGSWLVFVDIRDAYRYLQSRIAPACTEKL